VAEPSVPLLGESRRLAALLAAVVAPTTLVTGLAYYFGFRRERAFAGYFGIDSSVLGYSTSDYVLRSIDALFVPVCAVLLVTFAVLCLHVLFGGRLGRLDVAPAAALAGIGALAVGIALAAGHPFANEYGYLQALGPAVGAILLTYALAGARRDAIAPVAFVAVAVVLVSLFWATAEYADSRGRSEAARLARDITRQPSVTVFSKESLDIDPNAPGAGQQQPVKDGGCPAIGLTTYKQGEYRYAYSGFTLLVRSDGKYFLTPTPVNPRLEHWDPAVDAVFVIPDDADVRVEFTRGTTYPTHQVESTASGAGSLPFTC
jgi:hypothetical protein